MKIWIVVEIDTYNGDGDCWVSNYAGLKVFTSEKEANAYSEELDAKYATESWVDVVDIEVGTTEDDCDCYVHDGNRFV